MATCVAIIDKDNAPLYIRTIFDGQLDAQLKLHYTVHSSLDIIEGRLNQQPTAGGGAAQRGADLRELYLGLLLSSEDYRVYGYSTNTRVKFIVVVDLANTSLRDQEIRSIFKRLHNIYCRIVSNPFYVPSQEVSSKVLDDAVREMLVKS